MPPSTLHPRRLFSATSIRERTGGPACFTRICRIHERLRDGRHANTQSLAAELEVSPRTVKRDIELLRRDHHAPIEWEPTTQTYFYTAPFDLLSGLRLDADEALALILAGRTFAAWNNSPIGRALTAALGKIANATGSAVSFPASDLNTLLFQPEHDTDAEHRHFSDLIEHIRHTRELSISYLKPNATEPEQRLIHPLHLAHLEHRWMLVAHDTQRGAWRNFLLSRIQTLAPTGESFTPPPTAKVRDYLNGSLGRFTGDADIEVRLAFDATTAPYLCERPWHASQVITDRADGSIEVTLRLNNLIDVQRRILACGQHVEVLAPAELRTALQAELTAMLARYQPEKTSTISPPRHPVSPPVC